MKIIRHIILLLAVATLALSCRKEGLVPTPGVKYTLSDVPIRAVPVMDADWAPISRAVSDITAIDNSELQSRGFGVYAFYTGEEEYSAATDSSAYTKFGLVLNNRKFSYTAGAWTNTGYAEFWPATNGENLTLFAYAPWDTWNGVVAYDGKVPSIQYDNYVAQSLSTSELEKQRDLLWGVNTAGDPQRNVEKNDFDPAGTVDFHFRHATAKVKLNIMGSLPGEIRNMTSGGTTTGSNGTAGEPEDGPITNDVGDPVTTAPVQYNSSGFYTSAGYSYYDGYYIRYYHAVQTQTETESYIQTRYRIRTETSTGAIYSVSGQRYLVESVTLKGFNKKGTLVLNNTVSYSPLWTNVEKFNGADPEYVLSGSNVLSQSLRYVDASTVQSNFTTYTGITETASDMMSGYYLYAIPRESSVGDRIAVTIDYHKLNVNGTLTANQTREVIQKQTRIVSRTRQRTRNSDNLTVRSSRDRNSSWQDAFASYNAGNASSYTFSADFGEWSGWGDWNYPSWGNTWTDDTEGDWTITSSSLTGATVNYNDDTAPHLEGEIVTSLLGGRVYDINLIVAGDAMDLEVVPRPWDLYDFDFDYNASVNEVTQALTYDSAYIDYADGENVYINNRMGKFYFKLGAGKYASWQASLVPTGGSAPGAFGFTDENGNWLYEADGVTKVSSIRHAIDPAVMNVIYVKAVDSESTVTNSAKLRIYYIDAAGDATVALNLVNARGVTEWNIVQNAN